MTTRKRRSKDPRTPDKLTAGQAQVRDFTTALISWAQEHNMPPGLAVLGACEFIALSIQQNFPAGLDSSGEAVRVGDYLRQRVEALHDTTK